MSMDIQRAKEILSILADGINPTTGEVLPDYDSCNQVDVVRALHSILIELEKQTDKKSSKQPENAGKPWTRDEDERLVIEYSSGATTIELAKMHKRTKGSISSRLVKLGEIKERNEAR